MNLVPLNETFELMHECFPEVDTEDLIRYRDHCIAFKEGANGFVLMFPYNSGLFIQYFGVREDYRRKGIATRMMNAISEMAGRPIYAEVQLNSLMYHMLKQHGWDRVPITYVCPAWGNEPVDESRVLMTSNIMVNPLLFIHELYAEGYRNPSPELLQLYKNQLNIASYTPDMKEQFIKLFSTCFEDDPATILESIERAKLWLVVEEGMVKAFMLYNPYPSIHSVVVEYVGVAAECRKSHMASAMFRRLYDAFPGWAFYGECHLGTPIMNLLTKDGWEVAPVDWVCPAWGAIPEDTTRSLICRGAEPADVPAFAQAFYTHGYGVERPDLVEKYRKEVEGL